jgi:hypothetical protein
MVEIQLSFLESLILGTVLVFWFVFNIMIIIRLNKIATYLKPPENPDNYPVMAVPDTVFTATKTGFVPGDIKNILILSGWIITGESDHTIQTAVRNYTTAGQTFAADIFIKINRIDFEISARLYEITSLGLSTYRAAPSLEMISNIFDTFKSGLRSAGFTIQD